MRYSQKFGVNPFDELSKREKILATTKKESSVLQLLFALCILESTHSELTERLAFSDKGFRDFANAFGYKKHAHRLVENLKN